MNPPVKSYFVWCETGGQPKSGSLALLLFANGIQSVSSYGDATVKAVKNYQRAKGLVQDGKAGPATQRYLYEGDFPDQA